MGRKVKGRSGARFSWSTCGGPLASKAAAVAELKAEREPAPEGEKVPAPMGLPAGWTATKHTYVSGKYQGKSYLRFASADGKHKNICTLSAAIKKDAADKGYDPQPALQQLETRRQEVEKQRQEKGPPAEQKAVEAFRAKHGRLDRCAAGHLPGWSLETYVLDPLTGQKATRYNGPKGESFTQLKQVEALLGSHILAGTDAELGPALERAREMGKEEPKILKGKVLKRKAGTLPARGKKASKSKKNAMDVDGKKNIVVKKKITKKKGR